MNPACRRRPAERELKKGCHDKPLPRYTAVTWMNQKGLRVEWVDVVDGENRVIGVAERAKVRRENLCHRASYILVLDEADRILVQRRTLSKDFCPGMLDACAGGVVTTGEQMEPSARRELAEELGIEGVPLRLQAEEVSEVCWMSQTEIAARTAEFTPDSLLAIATWQARR